MSWVTPLTMVTLPSGISTWVGYQRPYFMGWADVNELVLGSNRLAVRRPSSSMTPTSAGSPLARSSTAGSLYQSVPPLMSTRPSASDMRSPQNMSPSFFSLSSGVDVGSCGGTPAWPARLPTSPSPGRPGTPTAPTGSS